jgi:hypothetical protein
MPFMSNSTFLTGNVINEKWYALDQIAFQIELVIHYIFDFFDLITFTSYLMLSTKSQEGHVKFNVLDPILGPSCPSCPSCQI